MARLRFEKQFPEPLRCWIVHAPRRWPGPSGWWLDLAREELVEGSLGHLRATPDLPAADDLAGLVEVSYLPAVDPAANWWRQELRGLLVDAGADPIVQQLLGEDSEAGGGVTVVDLTPALLPPRPALFEQIPAGSHCAWPLIPGVSVDAAVCRKGLERLARSGAGSVQPVVPSISAGARRKLGEFTNRRGYQELFHGAAPSVVDFVALADEYGLSAFLERPACGRSGRALANRSIASSLHELGELILRTGGSLDESLSYYRAGRWADEVTLDVADLARSGNLSVVPQISAEIAEEVRLFLSGDDSPMRTRLELEYRGATVGQGGR